MHSHFLMPTGGTKFIFEVVRRLSRRRPVEVVVERASPLWRERYAEENVPLHEIGRRTSTSMVYWAGFPQSLRANASALAPHVEQCAAVVSSFFPMPWLASRALAGATKPHVSLCFEPFPFFHDREVIGLYPRPKQALLAFLRTSYGWMDKRGIEQADSLLTLNASTAREIKRVYGREDAILTYAGVDTTFFHPYAEEALADLRTRFGPGPLVIHSTDFSPIKRTDLAVAAFAEAAMQHADAKLLVTSTREDAAGLAQMRAQAQSLRIGDRVEYLGFVPYADLPRLYSLANVLLQTGTSAGSGATTMSLPVKEALACGTPVVRSEATDEDVEDGRSGFLVDPRDSRLTGARISTLLEDPQRSRAMGERGRLRIVDLYDWDRVTQVFADALTST